MSNLDDSPTHLADVLTSDSQTPSFFSTKRVNIRLDEKNYLLSKQQIFFTVRGHSLEHFLDSSTTPPSKFSVTATSESIPNLAYAHFVKQDYTLALWLLSTVSPNILSQLVGAETSASIWSTLTHFFSSLSTTKVMYLHCKLHSLRKSVLSMRDYLFQIKEVSDTLATYGSPISDIKHITTILNGLPQDYDSFVAVITSSQELYTLDRIMIILLDAESRLHDPLRLPLSINTAQVRTPTPTDFVSNPPLQALQFFLAKPNAQDISPPLTLFLGHGQPTIVEVEAETHHVYSVNFVVG
ncbi:hypothetical protein PVK06_000699 [Gossypium arboreum]|uniref:Uncharacterized protein n=1 Tax=Gossypium arboreum TaxID=29729 RepID=A0ABR0QZ88_GOSAR|nr:hypothetical protein PVK06_000699 [Gossypium arboreum]